jgi:hypothetical protein
VETCSNKITNRELYLIQGEEEKGEEGEIEKVN